jgi:hypothetical protein
VELGKRVTNRPAAYVGRGVQQGLAAFPGAMGYLGAQMYPEDNPELFEEE